MIQAIPNAIGALCLNQAGQDQLTARPTIIPCLFSIFTSERHQRVLQDKENAVLIGSAVDELIRHHPSLKSAVFEAIKSTLSKIEDLGSTFTPPEGTESWYELARASASGTIQAPTDDDILMRSSDTVPVDESASEPTGRHELLTISLADDILDENATGRSHENIIVSYLDVICRVISFSNPTSSRAELLILSSWKACFSTPLIAKTSFPTRTALYCWAGSQRCLAYHMISAAVSRQIR